MFDTIGGSPDIDSQLNEIRGIPWARFTLVLFGIGAAIYSFLLIGIPLLFAVRHAWRGLDAAERFRVTRDPEDARDATRSFLLGARITVIWFAVFIVLYVGAIVFLTVLGALLGDQVV